MRLPDLRLRAKSDRRESSVPVDSTNDSIARNWICVTRIIARVTDGWRTLTGLLSVAASAAPCDEVIASSKLASFVKDSQFRRQAGYRSFQGQGTHT